MPTKHEPKPCTVEGCDGTMIYTHFLVLPHGTQETLGPGGLRPKTRPCWKCGANNEHIEWDDGRA